ncbi:hypothetical protein [Methanobrevibacter sp.]|uniref:hypothetical protein n=1 Tax=Methanobrevibacter sp. TaxID=66852 RepID=UPI0026E071A5|nr:hypothetical protein [Methanobrevibacter sp.]MDO5859437.1 hypothetical protein [Methanobrevibacter sp.]
MGFYSANTLEQKRVKQLTGDINIHDMFKNECKTRGIPIYNAYNIQKRLIHEVEQEQIKGVDAVDDRLMELLDERGKNKVTHRYVDFVSREDSASRGVIPKMPEENDKLPPKDQIKIPPRARDGQTFKTDNELPEREMLIKIMNQNKKIINQNKIIIEQLKRLGEKDD